MASEGLRIFDVADGRSLRQLKDEAGGINAGLIQRPIDETDEVAVTDGLTGDVHTERDRVPSPLLFGNQRDGLLHNPRVEREDRSEALGHIQKSTRQQHLAPLAPESHQQFVLADLVVSEIEDRLTVQLEPIVFERLANALGFHQPRRCPRRSALRRLVQRKAVSSCLLGFVHREIGTRQDLNLGVTLEQATPTLAVMGMTASPSIAVCRRSAFTMSSATICA